MAEDYSGQYNTPLPQGSQAGFQQWLSTLPQDMDKTGRDYDLQGAYLAGLSTAGNGHLTDTFKKPNHPTFSVESQYSRGPMMGGKWTVLPSGKEAFVASPINLAHHNAKDLQQYFGSIEPDIQLVLPTPGYMPDEKMFAQ